MAAQKADASAKEERLNQLKAEKERLAAAQRAVSDKLAADKEAAAAKAAAAKAQIKAAAQKASEAQAEREAKEKARERPSIGSRPKPHPSHPSPATGARGRRVVELDCRGSLRSKVKADRAKQAEEAALRARDQGERARGGGGGGRA